MTRNRYSALWFRTFLRTVAPEQTEREVTFLQRHLPVTRFPRLLDVACGEGRLAWRLARLGHRVTAIDVDADAIATARRGTVLAPEEPQAAGGSAAFVQGDMRDLAFIQGTFDGVLCMWASFGFFDARTNHEVLERMAAHLRPGGRLVLDLYDPAYARAHAGERTVNRGGRAVKEVKEIAGDRLRVRLGYEGSDVEDVFEWHLYDPAELFDLTRPLALDPVLACAGFDDDAPPAGHVPRMQIVLERRATVQ